MVAKKVLIITPSYAPRIGGVEKHVEQLAMRLSRSYDVEILTIEHSLLAEQQDEPAGGLMVKRFRSTKISTGIEIPSRKLADYVVTSGADIVHLHSFHSLLPRYVLPAIRRLGSACVVTPHYHGTGHTLLRKILFGFYKPSLSKLVTYADSIICVSEYERSLLLKDFPTISDKSIVIPNAIDIYPDQSSIQTPSKEVGRILFVGRLEKYKNVDKIVRALPLLPHVQRDFRLTIVGNGPELDRLLALVNTHSLQDKVEFKRNLSKSELAEEYRRAELFLMPSYHEAYGIAVAEALSFGCKVAVANSSALSEFIGGGYASGIELPITASKLAKAVVELSDGVGNATKNYPIVTWDTVTEKIEAIYDSVLRNEPSFPKKHT